MEQKFQISGLENYNYDEQKYGSQERMSHFFFFLMGWEEGSMFQYIPLYSMHDNIKV